MLADNHRLTPTQLIADLTNCQLKYDSQSKSNPLWFCYGSYTVI